MEEDVLGPLATFGCSTRLAGMMRHTGCSKLFERIQKITARIESRNIPKIKKTATDAENAAGGWEVKERSQERDWDRFSRQPLVTDFSLPLSLSLSLSSFFPLAATLFHNAQSPCA
jgi:hypothetical protein